MSRYSTLLPVLSPLALYSFELHGHGVESARGGDQLDRGHVSRSAVLVVLGDRHSLLRAAGSVLDLPFGGLAAEGVALRGGHVIRAVGAVRLELGGEVIRSGGTLVVGHLNRLRVGTEQEELGTGGRASRVHLIAAVHVRVPQVVIRVRRIRVRRHLPSGELIAGGHRNNTRGLVHQSRPVQHILVDGQGVERHLAGGRVVGVQGLAHKILGSRIHSLASGAVGNGEPTSELTGSRVPRLVGVNLLQRAVVVRVLDDQRLLVVAEIAVCTGIQRHRRLIGGGRQRAHAHGQIGRAHV